MGSSAHRSLFLDDRKLRIGICLVEGVSNLDIGLQSLARNTSSTSCV